jgi:hypothetical protein
MALLLAGVIPLQAQVTDSAGATDWFGPGVTGVRRDGALLRLRLLRPASVAVLQIFEVGTVRLLGVTSLEAGDRWIEVLPKFGRRTATGPTAAETAAPLRDACHMYDGRQGVVSAPGGPLPGAPPSPACYLIVRPPSASESGAAARAPSQRNGLSDYILFVVSDTVVTAGQLEERLNTVRVFGFETIAHDLPEYLVGRRTPMWAGYLVAR